MEKINRRSFIKQATTLAAGISVAAAIPSSTWARPAGANNDIRIAVVGLGGQGRYHVKTYNVMKGVRVVALCDPDRERMQDAAEILGKKKFDKYVDYRKLLEDKDIDAVSTASCNHWHAPVTVWGCEAGKDVFVEKPVCHTIWEGQQMIKAARKYNRIVQSGMQLRSDTGVGEAFQWLHEGNLGKMLLSRGLCIENRSSIGKVDKPTPIPDYIDYDLWCGPAQHVPLMRKRLHFDWHWIWNTGNGDLGNQGIHQMDMCRRAIRQDKLPPRVISVGGRFGWNDDGQSANTQLIFCLPSGNTDRPQHDCFNNYTQDIVSKKGRTKSALPLLCNRGRRFIAGALFEPTTLLSKSLESPVYVRSSIQMLLDGFKVALRSSRPYVDGRRGNWRL